MKSFKTVKALSEGYYEEKKSKFLCYLTPVSTEEEVKEILAQYKKDYRDANHHCSAYILGGDVPLERYGDDGEPAGTAGLPMLEVLRGEALKYTLAIVIRYFGGTKLGTGGLVRAYTKAVQSAFENAQVIQKGHYVKYQLKVPYTLSGKVDYFIKTESLLHSDTSYSDDVGYTFYCIVERYEEESQGFVELLNNQCEINKLQECMGYVSEGEFISDVI